MNISVLPNMYGSCFSHKYLVNQGKLIKYTQDFKPCTNSFTAIYDTNYKNQIQAMDNIWDFLKLKNEEWDNLADLQTELSRLIINLC
jgi:hypothetical protein